MKEYNDQEFLYRQTPVNYDGIAKFTSIKGNTLGWNQLVPSLSAMQGQNGTLSVADNVATITSSSSTSYLGTATSGSSVVLPKGGHKYLLTAEVKSSKAVTSCQLSYGNSIIAREYNISANTWTKLSSILSHSSPSGQYVQFRVFGSFEQGDTMQVRNWNYFDLTAMGLDSITSVEEFASLFPLPFYDFNQGTLIPFSGNGVKTVGKNLLNARATQTTNGITFTNDNGVITINGTATANAYFVTNIGLPNGSYFIGAFNDEINNYVHVAVQNKSGAYPLDATLSSKNRTLSLNNDIDNFIIWINNGTTLNNFVLKPMVSFESSEYFEPYTSSTTNLPTLAYFPNGMKSAGNVYDELTENKAITRVGSVDLGSLTWEYRTTGSTYAPYFYASFTGIKPNGNPNVRKANILCSKYSTAYRSQDVFIDKTICADGSSTELTQLQIKDSSYTDTTAFKNSLQGQYLYYEMVNETETDAEDIFYKFYADGTEQILPVNGATPTTAPIIADIEYYNQIESETPYRKFWLVNGNGERWDLTEKELKSFLENPQGLGFQKTIDVTRYGERAYKNTESYNFPQVTGDVLFYDSANSTRYEKYNEFVRFLMEQPITLHYMIPVSYNSLIADTYSLECEVMSLTKTESKTDRILTSNIQMNGLGFYEGDEIEINGTANTLTINNKGDFPVGFEIELRGTYKNPYFTLEQNGELYGEAKFDDNANNFSSVFVNSKDGEQNVVLKQNNSTMPNPLAYQDLSISNGSIYVTFVKLAKGESTLTIGGDSYTISGYTIKFTPTYRSV